MIDKKAVAKWSAEVVDAITSTEKISPTAVVKTLGHVCFLLEELKLKTAEVGDTATAEYISGQLEQLKVYYKDFNTRVFEFPEDGPF